LNYGFRFFDTLQAAKSGEVIYEARIWQGESEQVDVVVEDDIFLTLPSNQTDKLQKNLELNERLTAPITKGEVLGQLVWSLDGKTVKIVSVVKQGSMLKRLKDTFLLWFSSLIDDVKSLFGDAL
jgi:D-alanyl-D-alanine carboxypeptidase (penicillin-binding protein 5/6)